MHAVYSTPNSKVFVQPIFTTACNPIDKSFMQHFDTSCMPGTCKQMILKWSVP